MDRMFIDDCIKSMNDYRRVHQVPPLTHNAVVSTIAQQWADQMTRTGSIGHNPNASYKGQQLGENCAFKWYSDRRDITGKEVIDQWYAEVKKYDFRRHSGSNTGHFTQLVWKSSREVGIGRAQSRDGRWFVVANFFPAGNFIGRNAENVLPPRDGKVTFPVANNDTRSFPSQAGTGLPSMDRSLVTTGRELTVTPSWSSGRSFQQTPTGGSTTVIQRRQQTKTVGGVTKTVVMELRRDGDGSVTSTTKQTTSTDDLPGRFARVGLTETRGFFTSSSSPTFHRHYQHTPPSSATPAASAAAPRRDQSPRMSSQSDSDFNKQIVSQHNVFRKQHGKVGDVKVNKEMSKIAQQWAEHLASINQMEHSRSKYKDQPLGENLAYKFASNKEGYNGDDVVKDWYSEISNVSFSDIESALRRQAGHFTQVVWKDSREIGIGRAFSDNDRAVYVVCNYLPAGNIIGHFKENVLPAK